MMKWRGLHLGRPTAIWRCEWLYGPSNYLCRSRERFPWSRWSLSAITRRLFAWSRRKSDRQPLLREEGEEKKPEQSPPTPKGHLVVYVAEYGGWSDGVVPPSRYVVPLVHFNHPLFRELLKEAVEEFGYDHPGGIRIPCPVERFERVKDRIVANHSGRRRFAMKRQECS